MLCSTSGSSSTMRIFLLPMAHSPPRNFLIHKFLNLNGHSSQIVFYRFTRAWLDRIRLEEPVRSRVDQACMLDLITQVQLLPNLLSECRSATLVGGSHDEKEFHRPREAHPGQENIQLGMQTLFQNTPDLMRLLCSHL